MPQEELLAAGSGGPEPASPSLPGTQRHLQSGWESPRQPCSDGHLRARLRTPAPRSPSPFASRQGTSRTRLALRNPRSFHPSRRSRPPGRLIPVPSPGMAAGGAGAGSGPGSSAGGRALSAQPWLGPGRARRRRWQGSAEAQPDVLHQAWDAAAAAYPPRAQVLPAPLSRHRGWAGRRLWPPSPGLQTARGAHAPTPGAGCRGPGRSAGARDG